MIGYTAKSLLTPFNDKPTTQINQTIAKVLEASTSSHSPIYVFDGNNFVGVIAPYQAIYGSNHTLHSKKVQSALVKIPVLSIDSTLYDIARAMMDTRLYELPILDKKQKIIGVVTSKSLLELVLRDEVIFTYLADCVIPRKPVTHPHKGTVGDIYHLMRDKGVSRIVLVDHNNEVSGIVTRSDIKIAYTQPSSRQRFRGSNESPFGVFFDGEETYREDDLIERFSKKIVYTLPNNLSLKEIIIDLVSSEYNAVVLVDTMNKPVGFISNRDLIHCLATFEPDVETPLVFKKPDDSVPEQQIEKSKKDLEKMIKKLSKIQPIEKVEVAVTVKKFTTQKVADYDTRITISMKGDNVQVSANNKEYRLCVKNAIDKAENVFIKTIKHTYHKTQNIVI